MNNKIYMILRFFLAFTAFISIAAWAQDIGRIEFATGEVNIIRKTQSITAVRGTSLLEGDVIETGASGQVQMRMADNAFLAMRPGSSLKLDQYRVTGNATEGAVMSLARGILRTFTGAIAGRDKSKFIMKAQNATVGIRGSGNILSYNDKDGTVNHTLTGAHSVTAKDAQGIERTLISKPGQTVQVAPGGTPKFIPTPAYIFAAASTSAAVAPAKEGDAPATEPVKAPAAAATAAVTQTTAPTTTTAASTTTTQAVAQTLVNTLAARQFAASDDLGVLIRYSTPFGTTAQKIGVLASGGQGPRGSDAIFDINGNLLKIANINVSEFVSFPGGAVANFTPRSIDPVTVSFSGGTAADYFRNADNSIVIGRWQGGQITVTKPTDATFTPVIYQLGNTSASYAVYRELPLGILYSLTGTTSYKVDAATRPTDSFGNVGQLVSAYINANFSTRTADMGMQIAINNQNLSLSGTGISFSGGIQFAVGNTVTTCTGTNCNTNGYRGTMNANFAGNNGTAIASGYRINPNRLSGQAFTDFIVGNIAFTALSTPTSISLPLTGSLSLNMNRLVDQFPGTSPTTGNGTINANFSTRTLDFVMNFIDSGPTNASTYTARATGVPIIGVGFGASSNNTALRNDGKVTFSCVGFCDTNTATITSRFDGYFTSSQGNGAVVNIFAAGAGQTPGPDNGLVATAYFGTAIGALSATNTLAPVLRPIAGASAISPIMVSLRGCALCAIK